MSKARRQIGDQSTKGAAIGLCVYGEFVPPTLIE